MENNANTNSEWRHRLTEAGGLHSRDAGRIIDLDLRVSRLSPGAVKDHLSDWIDEIGHGHAGKTIVADVNDGTVTANPDSQRDPFDPLNVLEEHVTGVEEFLRLLRFWAPLSWVISILIWGVLTATLVWWIEDSACTFVELGDCGVTAANEGTITGTLAPHTKIFDDFFGISVQISTAVFSAGVTGSIVLALLRVYRQDISIPETFLVVKRDDDGSRVRASIRVKNQIVGTVIRAAVRPILGGLFAIGVMTLLLSGLVLEPIAGSLVEPSSGKIDFGKVPTASFFLALGFLAGLSDDVALKLFQTATDKIGGGSSDN